jgi:holliday junction DNA helicase RuvA
MIGWLRGVVREKRPPQLILDVQGVGYELEAPMTTFYTLPEIGREVTLYTHLVVREDAHQLFGFASETERNIFRLLLKVSGVGAKLALAILSGMDAKSFARCVFEGDTSSLAKLPGIGKKTAERLVIEMRDRLDRMPTVAPGVAVRPGEATFVPSDPISEAVSALIALGFKPPEASRLVHGVDTRDVACEEIVRRALKNASK